MFEFDNHKSQSNLQKHGIDFDEAQQIWLDPNFVEIPAKAKDESRSLVIGRINNRFWSAIITYRGSSIRIISVRRSRKEERAFYES